MKGSTPRSKSCTGKEVVPYANNLQAGMLARRLKYGAISLRSYFFVVPKPGCLAGKGLHKSLGIRKKQADSDGITYKAGESAL
jgi:hypothetical protein